MANTVTKFPAPMVDPIRKFEEEQELARIIWKLGEDLTLVSDKLLALAGKPRALQLLHEAFLRASGRPG